jgi:antitoxin component HigA of HigAB toxin-antitoxin module
VKPIRTEEDHRRALARITALAGAERGSAELDELEILSVLVERYERDIYPCALPDAIAAVLFRMEQEGLSRKELEAYIGSRARVSEVLSGKRPLSITMIRALHRGLGIPALVLIAEPVRTRRRKRERIKAAAKNGLDQMKSRLKEAATLTARIAKDGLRHGKATKARRHRRAGFDGSNFGIPT